MADLMKGISQRDEDLKLTKEEARGKDRAVGDLNSKIELYEREIQELKRKTQDEIQAQEAITAQRLKDQLNEKDQENKRLRESVNKANEMERILKEEKENALKRAHDATVEAEAEKKIVKDQSLALKGEAERKAQEAADAKA